jgi:hypothetical protein
MPGHWILYCRQVPHQCWSLGWEGRHRFKPPCWLQMCLFFSDRSLYRLCRRPWSRIRAPFVFAAVIAMS